MAVFRTERNRPTGGESSGNNVVREQGQMGTAGGMQDGISRVRVDSWTGDGGAVSGAAAGGNVPGDADGDDDFFSVSLVFFSKLYP